MSNQRNKVRIIGGRWRGTKLSVPDRPGLRPSSDRVRETLFNWLMPRLGGARVLDLFAGSGALGFEAASRNAAKVVAVETAKPALEALRANQAMLGAKNIEIVWSDALRYLDSTHESFDVVFLDPPFASDFLAVALQKLSRILKPGARVYAECARWPELTGWELVKDGRAGQVCYGLLRQTGA